jgi:hypothetical protein
VWILIVGIAVSMSGRFRTNTNQKSIRFIFIWALLFYTATGVSLVFAYAIDPSFRCWNRLSIVIMTLALVALGATLSRFTKFNKAWFPILLVIAVLSQLSPLHDSGIGPEPDIVSKDAFSALQQVAAVIQREIKPGCQILQLPIMAFPEGGQVGQVGNGAHLWLPMLTSGFRWSYGAPKGTQEGDYWPKLSGESIQMQVKTAARESFCAVIIDLRSDIEIGVTDLSPYRLVLTLGYYAIYSA